MDCTRCIAFFTNLHQVEAMLMKHKTMDNVFDVAYLKQAVTKLVTFLTSEKFVELFYNT